MFDCIKPGTVLELTDGSFRFGTKAPPGAKVYQKLLVRCGKCQPCLCSKSREMSIRGVHETKMHPDGHAHFLTFTYDDDHVPDGLVLVPRDLQLGIKRMRRALAGCILRYIARGEYGSTTSRPHYHLIGWGFPLNDLVHYSGEGDRKVYSSAVLDEVWGLGAVKVGSVTPASVQYCAGYLNKLDPPGPYASLGEKFRYAISHPVTGEIVCRPPPFNRYSTHPGIGAGFAEAFDGDLWPSDFCVMDGSRVAVPRYYLRLKERQDPEAARAIKEKRELASRDPAYQQRIAPERRQARAAILKQRMAMAKRGEGIR